MKLTVAWAFPALAVTVVGLPGAVAGVGVTLAQLEGATGVAQDKWTSGVVDDLVARGAAAFQGEVEAGQLELDPDDGGVEDAHGLLEQLLSGLVALEDHDGVGVHSGRFYRRCGDGSVRRWSGIARAPRKTLD